MAKKDKENSRTRFKTMKLISENYLEKLRMPKPHIIMRRAEKSKSKEAMRYVKAFDRTLSSLDDKYRDVIKCSFLEPHLLDWLKGQYASATFYRLRDKSISQFIKRFPHENY